MYRCPHTCLFWLPLAMKELPMGYYPTFQPDDGFGLTSHRISRQSWKSFACKRATVLLPMEEGEKETDCDRDSAWWLPCSWNMFLFIQSRVKIAILLIKTHLSQSFMLQSKRKTNWNDQCLFWGLISRCALRLQNACKHNENHGTKCLQYRAKIQTATKSRICNDNAVSSYCIW